MQMANANPSGPGRNINVPALTPNPVVEKGETKTVKGQQVRVDKLMNGDTIETNMTVDQRFIRRGSRG